MANYTDYLNGKIKVGGFNWVPKKIMENFFVLISPGENYLSVR